MLRGVVATHATRQHQPRSLQWQITGVCGVCFVSVEEFLTAKREDVSSSLQ